MEKDTVYGLRKEEQFFYLLWICYAFLFIAIGLGLPSNVRAQEKSNDEEIYVSIYLQGLNSSEIPAIVRDGQIFLSPADLFDFLQINQNLSESKDTLTGFLLNPKDTYLIDANHRTIWYQQKKIELTSADIIQTTTGFYLKKASFGNTFGLNIIFNFRSLSIHLETKLDLPFIRALRQEQIRASINRLHGIEKIDTTIARTFPFFRMGMADWSIISTQQHQGINFTGINLSLGAAIAGGETDLLFHYNNEQKFSNRNQQYLWRFVNNENPLIKQVVLGKISPPTIASIYGPVTGVRLTNASSINRNAFGTYKISDMTEPGWKVELYVNNELIDYQQADASGFFTFDVPIIYGNTIVELRFYGPWGEERIQRRNVNIPFDFLPSKELEYNLYAGIIEDGRGSRYTKGNLNYGLNKKVTIGGGLEYLSSLPDKKITPFLNTSLRLTSNLLLYGEYVYKVRTKAILNYRLPSDLALELNYIIYDKEQRTVLYNYREERKVILSFPIRYRSNRIFSRLTINQIKLTKLEYTNIEWLFSGVISGISTNLTTYSHFGKSITPLTYSILSQTYLLPERILFTPQIQYQYNAEKISVIKIDLERPFFKSGYVKLSFEKNLIMRTYNTAIGIRYDLPFARTLATVSHNSYNGISLTQSASGSLLFDQTTQHLIANNNGNVGKAGFVVIAFLDLNENGKRDLNEPKVTGLSLRINGGVMKSNMKDTLITVTNLEPFRKYRLMINSNSFDNLAWILKKSAISVTAEPNQFKLIEIPVTVAAEISGTVYMKNDKELIGLEKIKVNIYDQHKNLIKQVITETDGYFSYLGLTPGSYIVTIEVLQLQNLKATPTPKELKITVRQNPTGDVINGLNFVLNKD